MDLWQLRSWTIYDALLDSLKKEGISDEEKMKIRSKMEELKEQHNALVKQCEAFKASPSYDIYAAGTVLPGLFFGSKGCEWSNQFWNGSKQYLEAMEKMVTFDKNNERDYGEEYERRVQYFKDAFTELNQEMGKETKQKYSNEEIQKMSILMAWMMDPEPANRPASEQVFTSLMDLNGIQAARKFDTEEKKWKG
jgi:hypothetical protein